jgi:hypothetical protein
MFVPWTRKREREVRVGLGGHRARGGKRHTRRRLGTRAT